VYDFAWALVNDIDMPSSSTATITADDAGKLQKAAVKQNKIAMANFTMAFTSEGTISLIYEAETQAWPNGLASMVTDVLKAKYMPQDTVTRVELRQMLNKVSMKPNSNPAVIFEQISTIKNRYCNGTTRTIDDEDLIAVVLEALTKEYSSILQCEQRIRGTGLTVDHLKETMKEYWRQIKGYKPDKDNDKEMQLSGFGGRANIASKPDTKHMNVQRRLVTETVKVTAAKVTAKADSKESATIAVGKATKLTTAGRKKRTKKSGQSGIREKAASKVGAAATDASKSVKFALTAHKKFLFPETAELLKDKNV
jgi:predicted pyridoxine 5'-phosphate oxidase superfamily flavin-nucleotide-binding protein